MKEYSQTHVVFQQRRMVQLDGRHPGILSENVNRPLSYHQIENSKNHGKKRVKKIAQKIYKVCVFFCHMIVKS